MTYTDYEYEIREYSDVTIGTYKTSEIQHNLDNRSFYGKYIEEHKNTGDESSILNYTDNVTSKLTTEIWLYLDESSSAFIGLVKEYSDSSSVEKTFKYSLNSDLLNDVKTKDASYYYQLDNCITSLSSNLKQYGFKNISYIEADTEIENIVNYQGGGPKYVSNSIKQYIKDGKAVITDSDISGEYDFKYYSQKEGDVETRVDMTGYKEFIPTNNSNISYAQANYKKNQNLSYDFVYTDYKFSKISFDYSSKRNDYNAATGNYELYVTTKMHETAEAKYSVNFTIPTITSFDYEA